MISRRISLDRSWVFESLDERLEAVRCKGVSLAPSRTPLSDRMLEPICAHIEALREETSMKRNCLTLATCLSMLGLLLAGCVSTPVYVPATGSVSLPDHGLQVTIPDGWHRLMRAAAGQGGARETAEIPEGLVLTRDGLLLQQIRAQRVAVDEKLQFTKRGFDMKLSPHEVAEVELDDHRSNPGIFNLTVEENAPATIDGRQGFRLIYTWTTKDGYRLKRIHFGFMEGKWVYRLIYQAAARHYFDRDLPVFDRLRESFRLLAKAA